MPKKFRNPHKSKHKHYSREHTFYFQTQIYTYVPGPCRPLLFKHVCWCFFWRVVQSAGLLPSKYRSTKNNIVVSLHTHCAHLLAGKASKPWYLSSTAITSTNKNHKTLSWHNTRNFILLTFLLSDPNVGKHKKYVWLSFESGANS